MKTKQLLLLAAIATLFATACKDDAAEPSQPTQPQQPKVTLELGSITTNTTLEDIFTDPATPDYRVNGNIKISAILNIKPGVVIEVADDKQIEVHAPGYINATGEASKKIVFRGQTQTPGAWEGIIIFSSTEPTMLDHVEIAHAGSTELFDGIKAAVGLFGAGGTTAKLTIKNSHLHHNNGYGMYVASNTQLTGFSTNKFTDNTDAGLYMTANEVQKLDAASVFTNNGKGGIEVFTGSIQGPAEVVWPAYNYCFTRGPLAVKTGWKITAGAVIEMADGQYIEVSDVAGAYIHAAGTADKKVVFTGIKKEAGAWRGISIYNTNASNLLEHAVVEYGGSHASFGVKANIYVPFTYRLTIRNCKIANSPGYGVYYRSNAQINADFEQVNTFEGNAIGKAYRD